MKTDKEKMLAGEPYLAFCNELVEDRARAKDVLFEYNNLRPSDMERRTEIILGCYRKAIAGRTTLPLRLWL